MSATLDMISRLPKDVYQRLIADGTINAGVNHLASSAQRCSSPSPTSRTPRLGGEDLEEGAAQLQRQRTGDGLDRILWTCLRLGREADEKNAG
jgi:hypothetical protein